MIVRVGAARRSDSFGCCEACPVIGRLEQVERVAQPAEGGVSELPPLRQAHGTRPSRRSSAAAFRALYRQ